MTCVAGNNLATHCLGYVHRFIDNYCSRWYVLLGCGGNFADWLENRLHF